jgi:phosphate transport system substrate-binding protein
MKVLKALTIASLAAVIIGGMTMVSCNSKSGSGSDSTASANSDDNTIMGAGSSFDNPLFSKMFSEYNKQTGLKVNYQSIGSGGGIQQLTNKTVDFGASDAPLTDDQAAKMGAPAIHIPVTAGAVVISYNLPDVKDTLMLTPSVIADIFLGKITKWNDPKIAEVNKNVKLPATPIVVAHRADNSGTTNIFTTYLSKVSDEWNTKVGKGSGVNWPVGLGGKGSEGVAGTIKQTPGAIGYVELAYASQNNMAYAKVQNKAGNFITPGIASVTAAANIQIPADGKVSLTNTDAPDGYPISGLSWVLIYKEQNYNNRSQDKATKMLKLLWWAIHDGQQYGAPMSYAPLSPAAVTVGENLLKSATFGGKQILQ